jgi:hypothetical protein
MDRQYIRDHDVIERYLSRSLTSEEEQEFEEAYLGDAAIMDELEAAERLRDGIKELDGAGRLERLRPRPQWRRLLASPQYAAAASVLLAVSLGFSTALYRENRDLREGGLSPTSTITRFVALDSVRGGNTATIREPDEDEWTVLLLDAGPTEYDVYRAVLVRQVGERSEEIWSRADLAPELDGTILIGVPGRVLRPGNYETRLEGRMSNWPAERFDEITRTRLTVVARD